jgi:signal transduction histidine kinase
MKKIGLSTLVLWMFVLQTTAQSNATKDSLMQLIIKAKEDSSGVELYLKAGAAIENNDPAKAGDYYKKARVISEKIKYSKGVIKSIIYYSSVMNVTGKYDSGIYFNQQALDLSRIEKDTFLIGVSLLNIGIAHQQMSNSEEAIPYFMEGTKLIEKSADPKNKNIQMQLNGVLQVLYNDRAQYDEAISFGEKARLLAKELKDQLSLCQILLNLSFAYREKKMLQQAEKLAKEGLQIAIEEKDKRYEAGGLLAVASIWEREGVYDKILPYAQRSLLLSRESGSIDIELASLFGIAVCYLQQKDFAKAEVFANEALRLSQKNQTKREESTALRILSRIAYASGKLVEGARFDLNSESILGDYVRSTLSQQSANLEKKYETEKKNNQILQLSKDQKLKALWNYILIGAFATLLIISLLSYRNYKQKQKLQQQQITELEKEKKLLAAEAILKGQIDERTRLAKDLHDGLGGMLSGIKHSFTTMKENLVLTPDNALAFERSMDMLDSSIKELRMVAHNLMPESLVKFGLDTALKDFCSSITASGVLKVNYHSFGMEQLKLDSGKEIIIYRIVQELISNTIKHAAAKESIVQLEFQNNQLDITVEDDGKGFDVNSLNIVKGIGWSNIKNRAEYLKAKLNVNSQEGKGTSVHMMLDV